MSDKPLPNSEGELAAEELKKLPRPKKPKRSKK